MLPMCAKELLAVMSLAQKNRAKKEIRLEEWKPRSNKRKQGGCEVVVIEALALSIKRFKK